MNPSTRRQLPQYRNLTTHRDRNDKFCIDFEWPRKLFGHWNSRQGKYAENRTTKKLTICAVIRMLQGWSDQGRL